MTPNIFGGKFITKKNKFLQFEASGVHSARLSWVSILLLHVFAPIARSLICIPLDSINEPHLQQGSLHTQGFGGRT